MLFGLSAPTAAQLTGEMGSFSLAGLLYVGAALAVAPFAARQRMTPGALRRSAVPLSAAVVLGGMVGPVLLAAGLGRVPAATSSLLLNLELVFTTLVAGLVFREHIGRRVGAGTGLVVVGGAALAWSDSPDLRWGAALVAGACLCWAFDNSLTAGLDQIAPAHITVIKGAVAGTVNLAIGLLGGDSPSANSVLAALVIGGLGYGASITLWVAGARDLGAARGQLVFATAPFIGAATAWAVFDGRVTAPQAVAFVLGAAGVSLVAGSAHEHEHRHLPMEHEHEHEHDEHHRHHLDEPTLATRHTHLHRHEPMFHLHPHVPDLHHHHTHDD